MKKRVPSFWWDFTRNTDAIIVKSDEPQYPVLAKFAIGKDATPQIEQAEQMIGDLRAGRISLKRAASNVDGGLSPSDKKSQTQKRQAKKRRALPPAIEPIRWKALYG